MQIGFSYAANVGRTRPDVLSKRGVKVRDLVKQLEENGWTLDR